MDATTTEQVMSSIENGIKESKTVQEIAQDVASFYTDVDNIKFRAERIARTETLTAVSIGQWAATKDVADEIPGMRKMWIAAGDARVRDSHAEMDGDVVAVNNKFGNGLMFPRDPAGPPEEIINCRCTLLMIPSEDDIFDEVAP